MASKIISNTNNLTELSVEQITEARVTGCTPAIHLKVCHRYLLPSLLFALGALLSASALATPIHLLFERDADGQAGNELAVVSYPDLPSLISSTSSFTQFTQVDVSSAFSVGGITFDGSAYRTLFERDADGQAGNELAVVSYPSFADLIGSTNSFTQFTQVDVSSAFSVSGFYSDPPENQNVSEPVTLSLLVLGLLTIGLDSRVRKRLII